MRPVYEAQLCLSRPICTTRRRPFTPRCAHRENPYGARQNPRYTGAVKIKLEYVVTLKLSAPPSGSEVELPEGTTAEQLLDRVGISLAHRKSVPVFVNNERALPARKLQAGDHVFLALPLSGG